MIIKEHFKLGGFMTFLQSFLQSFWQYLLVSSPYLLFGFFLAGIIKVFLSKDTIKKYLGRGKKSNIITAALIGVPLPLCSCSVIPTAVALKKAGASNSATSSFLISTPESGVDSIMMTYALIDLPMTIIRPIAAFLSGFMAGFLNLLFNEEKIEKKPVAVSEPFSCPHCVDTASQEKKTSFWVKIKEGLHYSFTDLMDDMAGWMLFGLVLGALIDFIIPANFFATLSPTAGRLIILVIAIPLYICASASTPIAAALIMKGLSPGMALIFLLVGPATNISNIAVLQKYIGKKGVILNLLAIVFVALALSYLTDWLYNAFNWPHTVHLMEAREGGGHEHSHSSSWLNIASAVILLLLLLKGIIKSFYEKKEDH
jgi:hypothetical protein